MAWVLALLPAAAMADGTVWPTLNSPVSGKTIYPNSTVDWNVRVRVSTGDNQGLALLACDLVQAPGNPALFDVPPGNPTAIPPEMSGFDRPGGITNPGEGGAASGYIGVQRGQTGQMNLVQIGGAQNTFGQAGSVFGTDPVVDPGIGQGASPQLVVSGSFPAPAAPGSYTFSLQNAIASVLITIGTPPEFSQVSRAAVNLDGASFSFTVVQFIHGDLNCDGQVNFGDINPFVLRLSNPALYQSQYPNCPDANGDCSGDGQVNFGDINPFVALLSNP
jgi:hypothetical protein